MAKSSKPNDEDRALARKARRAAIVIAGAMLLWMGLQYLGARLGWSPYLVFAFDLLAALALIWALAVTYTVYRARRKN